MTRGMQAGTQAGRQTTLREPVAVTGIGVHSGWPVTVTLHPAQPDTGIVFARRGADGQRDREIPAHFHSVTATEFATVLGDRNGPAISTTEHVLAALCGLGIDNAVVGSMDRKSRSWTAARRPSSMPSTGPVA
jgi:UDP-3-O-[3-hydroxymyristoyl] N-acetylglucosamine deacetylase